MRHRPPDQLFLAEVIPPRALEAGNFAAQAMLASLAGETFALEVVATEAGPRWYVRAPSGPALEHVTGALRAAYPQAAVEGLAPHRLDLDPAATLTGERAVRVALAAARESALPLHTGSRDQSDPLPEVLAAARPPEGDGRTVCRLVIGPAHRHAADRLRRRVDPGRRWRERDGGATASPLPLLGALGAGAAALQGWRWYEAGDWHLLATGGAGLLVGLPLAVAAAVRVLGGWEPLLPAVVEEKLAGPLVAARLEVVAIAPSDHAEDLAVVAMRTAAAYQAYDGPAGGGLRPGGRGRQRQPWRSRRPLLLSTPEVAALWHLPDQASLPAGIRRTTARRLAPAPGHATRGVRLGVSDGDRGTPVHLPPRLLHRNHLLAAKTRRGKSTMLRHLAAGVMERVAGGAEDTALVVVDPHQDLAEAVLEVVPEALVDRTVYLDFANLERPVGLNLLDVELFPDRDRTTEHIITMMNRLWPANWGPRMEGALRASVLALLQANAQVERRVQYTLLDVAPFLTDGDLRRDILRRIDDPSLTAWWRDNYDRAGRTLQQQTANPVTSKIGRFTITEASRLVLGQPVSTYDPRAVVRDGGVLVVNTAAGALGEGAASLVGATLLNLIGLLVEEQVTLPPARRRRLVGLVDESSTLGAVDYPRMLSELGKYGASFVLATQSLSKLDAIDPNLAPSIFANADGLTVFQVSAEDAAKLTPELGGDLEVEDLVSLDDFTCYARWWDGHGRPPAFSFRVDPPPLPVPGRAQTIALASAARYGRPRDEVAREVMQTLAERSAEKPAGGRERQSKEVLQETVQQAATPSDLAPKTTARSNEPESAGAGQVTRRGNHQRPPQQGPARP